LFDRPKPTVDCSANGRRRKRRRRIYYDARPMYVKIVTFILTSATDTGELLTSGAGCFTPGKELHYPLHRRLGRYHSSSEQWRRENFHPLPGFEPQTTAQSLHRPRNATSHKRCLLIVQLQHAMRLLHPSVYNSRFLQWYSDYGVGM